MELLSSQLQCLSCWHDIESSSSILACSTSCPRLVLHVASLKQFLESNLIRPCCQVLLQFDSHCLAILRLSIVVNDRLACFGQELRNFALLPLLLRISLSSGTVDLNSNSLYCLLQRLLQC